ncbi:MAG: hypothetical protein P4N24_06500, partial [Acidobacteriota bacterium]|nr:hypothetical protein [Acidobacteriota bacterium]
SAIGCHKKMAAPAPSPPPPSLIGNESENLQESLFKGDQAVLSNQDIDRILSAHLTLENRHRLAVLGVAARWRWSEELSDLEAQNTERFMQALKAAPQLTQVRYVPSLLVPERRTVPYLREAAARFQADLLLVYTAQVQTFQKNRLVGTDEVRARCVVESVLLDVRTGIVIYAASGTEGVYAKRTPGDINFGETIAKAETDSTGKALLKVAADVVAFLRNEAK